MNFTKDSDIPYGFLIKYSHVITGFLILIGIVMILVGKLVLVDDGNNLGIVLIILGISPILSGIAYFILLTCHTSSHIEMEDII